MLRSLNRLHNDLKDLSELCSYKGILASKSGLIKNLCGENYGYESQINVAYSNQNRISKLTV